MTDTSKAASISFEDDKVTIAKKYLPKRSLDSAHLL
jgi:hypothetical protein